MMTKKTSRLRAVLKTAALIPVFVFACYACGDETKSLSRETLNLIAPSGDRISSSVDQLYEWTSSVALDKFGSSEFTITGIEYMDIAEGFVAQVNFEVNNTKSHYLLMRKSQLDTETGRMAQVGCDGTWQVSCSGTSCCTPNFNLGTGVASCSCTGGGSGCTLNVKCIEEAN